MYGSSVQLLAVSAIFSALVTVALDAAPFSPDERAVARGSTLEDANRFDRNDFEPPLAYLAATLGQSALGQGTVAVRLRFVLIGTAAAAIFGALLRRSGPRHAGLWTVALLTNRAFLFFARSASPTIALALVLLALLLVVMRWTSPPMAALLASWAGGALLMTAKRAAELRSAGLGEAAAVFRPSFAAYTNFAPRRHVLRLYRGNDCRACLVRNRRSATHVAGPAALGCQHRYHLD